MKCFVLLFCRFLRPWHHKLYWCAYLRFAVDVDIFYCRSTTFEIFINLNPNTLVPASTAANFTASHIPSISKPCRSFIRGPGKYFAKITFFLLLRPFFDRLIAPLLCCVHNIIFRGQIFYVWIFPEALPASLLSKIDLF